MGNALSREDWNMKLKENLEDLTRLAGKREPAPLMGKGEHHPYTMPLCNRFITEDMIRLFASAIGDPNPLWVDDAYAAGTIWGSIIAPPMCEVMIAETAAVPPPIELPGLTYMNGGSEREYHGVIRPRDEFTAYDTFLGYKEKSSPDKPYRLFVLTGKRDFVNQKDETVVTVISNILLTARYPENNGLEKEKDFSDAKRRLFSDSELAQVHRSYDDELSGKYRRGAEKLSWDSMSEGDELHPLIKGPYDYSDAVSFFGVTGYSKAFAKKWADIRINTAVAKKDSETGEYHLGPDWHFSDDLARKNGVPFAPIFGTHIEACLAQMVCNWMGDNAVFRKISTQIRAMIFMGDIFVCKGKVVRKYKANGENLVDLDVYAEKFGTDIVSVKGNVTVQL
jgi:acyl dehydratase